jgi:WD repeat-containing protein 59
MPSTVEPSKKRKTIRSAYDSETFDADVTIHVDGLVGSATISTSGRDVALASPEGLAIIDLDSPYSPPRRLSTHGLPWLVVDVQWSPFAARDYWVASTANHRCLIWNLNLTEDSANGAVEHSLQGHSRAITDINFSAHHPDILATCAVDGYVHKWDLRRPRQPVLTFCDWFAGATQVKWNRQDPNILASSHDRWLHIWDERNSSRPLKSINAHTSKIYGLDWNRTRRTGVVTCSLDKTIKFWDYDASSEPERIIRTDFPVWRARHTPFGWGLLAMPQNDPGNLYLYDRRTGENEPLDFAKDPVAVFPGHGSFKVKEFLWRSRGNVEDDIDKRDFQLVSWGEDNELRLHKPGAHVLESVGYVKGGPARKRINLTRKGATYKSFRSVEDHSNREGRSATMSDPRPGTGNAGYKRSALTMGMQMHHSRSTASPSWRGPSMKAKPATTKAGDRSLDPLGWMKGITMTKKKARIVSTPQRKKSEDSTTMFSPSYNVDHWGEPETLQEEILRVNQQLPNVRWENVDMHTLILDASLKGPWGPDGEPIHIKVKVDVPRNYPKSKPPTFIVEKTAFMSDQTHKRLGEEVNQVAGRFAKRKQNCLEVAFSYLLGETVLSRSTSFFKNVRDLDEDLDALADESSSSDDEDNDIPAGGSASMSQELPPNGDLDNTLAPINRGALPPPPRFCGARWSNDGRLIAFFPSKEEKAKASLFVPTDGYKERPKGEPQFAGFGRLQQDSPPPRERRLLDENSMADDRSDSDEADDSSSTSSDSETTYMHKVSMWYLPGRRFPKTISGSHSVRSSGGGTGVDTATGTGTSRRRSKPKNIVCLYNLTNLLPSKQEFAQEYAIFGDGPMVCQRNAMVAEKYGRPDLVHVWKYAALLLRHDIPLELLQQDRLKDSILVVAEDAVTRFEGLKSSRNDSIDIDLAGRVKWGLHPLARDFISDLFEYFEQTSDVQMLAMLSCVFSEASAEDSVAYAESHLSQPETPLPMKAPSFSLDYFPRDASLWPLNPNLKSQANSGLSTPQTLHTPIRISGSYGSDEGIWLGEPGSSSYPGADELPMKTPHDTPSDNDATQSLSTSPETRHLRRPNSNLASFTANLPRPFSSAASTSPPSRKRPSPADNFLSNLAPSNITWGTSTILGPASDPATSANTARNSQSDEEPQKDEQLPLVCCDILVQMEDQSIFDDDGWLSMPLLESSRNMIYASYRYAYGELLQKWDQPLARLEIMKFNVLKGGLSADHTRQFGDEGFHNSYQSNDNISHATLARSRAESPIPLGKKEQLQAQVACDRGLDVTGICRVHEIHLDPLRSSHTGRPIGGAVGTCERCKRAQMQLFCVYCYEPIDAQYVPCLGCGCALHEGCLAEWHAMGETECPAGDECECRSTWIRSHPFPEVF